MSKTRSLHSLLRLSGKSRWWAGVCVTGVLTTELGASGFGRLTAALDAGNVPAQVAASAQARTGTTGTAERPAVARGGRSCPTSKGRHVGPRRHRAHPHRRPRLAVAVCVTGFPSTARSNAAAITPVAAPAPVIWVGGGSSPARAVSQRQARPVRQQQRRPRPTHTTRVAVPAVTESRQVALRPQPVGTGQAKVVVAARPDPATSTSPVALYGRVKPTSATTSPSGRVCFYDGGLLTTLGCATLAPQVNGVMQAHIKVTLAKGTHSIVATYSGDALYAAGKSNAFALVVS